MDDNVYVTKYAYILILGEIMLLGSLLEYTD